jgi:phytoene dehydrogenase-like protein
MSHPRYDYVIVGAGLGGLFTGALLARHGCRVAVLERHYSPGGYGHSFRTGDYTFCAQLHYLWNCGAGDDFDVFLRRLGLEGEITFRPLDAGGFDRLHFPSFHYDICRGFDRNLDRLAARHPRHRAAIARYFDTIVRINRELLDLPLGSGMAPFALHPWRYWNVIRYRNWTTQDLFRRLDLPAEVQSILAGQSGDLLLPPSRASLLVQAGLACGYDSGPCVPAKSYEHLFATLVAFIDRQPGCRVHLKTWVKSLEVQANRVVAAHSAKGVAFAAERFLYNGDPARLSQLVAVPWPRSFRRKLDYEYSPSCFTLYLGVRGLDLERHGFGNWNVWHYAHDDVNRCYHEQLDRDRLENPSLFLSTPTLHHKEAQIAPAGCHQLVVCTPCRYEHFKSLQQKSRAAYLAEKERVTGLVLDQVEKHYLPGLRRRLDLVLAGTPTTNERFVFAPRGNAYGANLTPRQFNVGKIDYRTPLDNLWLVGASAGVPSFAGGIHFAMLLYEKLTGDRLRPEPKQSPAGAL